MVDISNFIALLFGKLFHCVSAFVCYPSDDQVYIDLYFFWFISFNSEIHLKFNLWLYIIGSFILNLPILSISCLNSFHWFVKPLLLYNDFFSILLLVFMFQGSLILHCSSLKIHRSQKKKIIILIRVPTWKL